MRAARGLDPQVEPLPWAEAKPPTEVALTVLDLLGLPWESAPSRRIGTTQSGLRGLPVPRTACCTEGS